jgi:hypothetical protein
MNLQDIQAALREQRFDAWLFYDHHRRDPIAYWVLKIAPVMCTRRWYYLIPAEGEPAKLVHRIERGNLAGLPGAHTNTVDPPGRFALCRPVRLSCSPWSMRAERSLPSIRGTDPVTHWRRRRVIG